MTLPQGIRAWRRVVGPERSQETVHLLSDVRRNETDIERVLQSEFQGHNT